MVTTGKTVTELIMGGRFILDKTTGEFHGQAFEGMGIGGFDRVKGKYVGIWLDNMGTGVHVSEGDVDATGNVVTSTSTYSCAMTGTVKQSRIVETMIDADTWKMEMYDSSDANAEYKAFEIVYKRAD